MNTTYVFWTNFRKVSSPGRSTMSKGWLCTMIWWPTGTAPGFKRCEYTNVSSRSRIRYSLRLRSLFSASACMSMSICDWSSG